MTDNPQQRERFIQAYCKTADLSPNYVDAIIDDGTTKAGLMWLGYQLASQPAVAAPDTVLARAKELAAEQAEDAGLWFEAITMPEAYLQAALRKLTAIIESTDDFGQATLTTQPAVAGAVDEEKSVYRVLLDLSASIDQYWNGDRTDAQIKKICECQAQARIVIDLANAATSQSAADGSEVERVARIINPGAWRVMDAELASMKRKYAGQNIGWPMEQYQHKESMAVATKVLASLRTASPSQPAAKGDDIKDIKARADDHTFTQHGVLNVPKRCFYEAIHAFEIALRASPTDDGEMLRFVKWLSGRTPERCWVTAVDEVGPSYLTAEEAVAAFRQQDKQS